ncbi:MAG TPA: Hpt domain-containing protein [Rhizomicrobium sp.]|jgi:chemotaxis protein histidine kinase CheA|nr:Hpt domain-containing protein [Rhizomicrobium sp.]
MGNKLPIEIFMPPNMLKAKVGGGTFTGLDVAAMQRAEKAMETLKGEFSGWIGEDVEKLAHVRDTFAALANEETRGDLFRASHDLKGQGLTFGFPFVARVASSLCKLLDSAPADAIPLRLVDAHVSTIRVILRDGIKGAQDRTASVLCEELEARTTEIIEKTTHAKTKT